MERWEEGDAGGVVRGAEQVARAESWCGANEEAEEGDGLAATEEIQDIATLN